MAARNMTDRRFRKELQSVVLDTGILGMQDLEIGRFSRDHVHVTVKPKADGNGRVLKKQSFAGRPDQVLEQLGIFAKGL